MTVVARSDRVVQLDGRAKAYRPLPVDARAAAMLQGMAAYARGDAFDAHEAWEPAWMGTDDVAERALIRASSSLPPPMSMAVAATHVVSRAT